MQNGKWGFLPGREASDALAKAFQHCDRVRALCITQALNIKRRRAGDKRTELVGGIAVALDISRAFDAIPRSEILALQAADVLDHLRQLVLRWITGAQYHVQGDNGTIAVDVCRGSATRMCTVSVVVHLSGGQAT